MSEPSHWRSLEHLAETPEFWAFAREEFPGFANIYESLGEAELADEPGLDRRKFLALSAAAQPFAGDCVLVNAFGCEGNNAALVLRRWRYA